jgi:hypothetical protein
MTPDNVSSNNQETRADRWIVIAENKLKNLFIPEVAQSQLENVPSGFSPSCWISAGL